MQSLKFLQMIKSLLTNQVNKIYLGFSMEGLKKKVKSLPNLIVIMKIIEISLALLKVVVMGLMEVGTIVISTKMLEIMARETLPTIDHLTKTHMVDQTSQGEMSLRIVTTVSIETKTKVTTLT